MVVSFISNHRKASTWGMIIACCLAIFAIVLTLVGCTSSNSTSSSNDSTTEDSTEEKTSSVQIIEGLANNPIDFAALKAQNPDVYAWLDFPGADISCPILQSSSEDIDYYLSHDINGVQNGIGEAYTQIYNTKTFLDPLTLIYGHSIDGTNVGFTNLHRLEDRATFDANPYFYIYTPTKILTYQVVTIQEIPYNHIFKHEDFSTVEGQQSYFDKLMNPTSELNYVRDEITLVGGDSRLVHLITCTLDGRSTVRYIVGGVLVAEQGTK